MGGMDKRIIGAAASLAGLGLLAWTGWGAYVNRTTERVPYIEVETVGDVEVREYPETIVVATRAENGEAAFRRLFEYIDGANRTDESVPMTAPVETNGRSGRSEEVSMTAPVETDRSGEDVRMEFFLPAEYTPETAPRPTDRDVELVIRPARTVAVFPFSGYARNRTVERSKARLLEELERGGIEPIGDPFLWQYNDPYTPPFMRHNEVGIVVDATSI